MPMTVEGQMQLNDNKKQFNFFKSLVIANCNFEVEILRPNIHEFWENVNIKKKSSWNFLGTCQKKNI